MRMRKLLLIVTATLLTACGDDTQSGSKDVTKIADLYFRFAVEHAVGGGAKYRNLMTPQVLAAGGRCVQDTIVSKQKGIYARRKLQSLILNHLFPNDSDGYKSFVSQVNVRDSLEQRVKKLGFKSVADAAKSTNLIAKGLVHEYAFYSRFNDIHKIGGSVHAENLVLKNCAPASVKEKLPA